MDISKAASRQVFILKGSHLRRPRPDLTTKSIPDSDLAGLMTQRSLASAWTNLVPSFPQNRIHVLPTVEHAVKTVETLHIDSNLPLHILVTGSLHLVGGIIEAGGLLDATI